MGTIRVYLNEKETKQLKLLSLKRKESQSAVVRKLISIEKYAKTLEAIEKNNEINIEFLYQLAQCGTNLNQIAYHLNIGIENANQMEYRLPKIIEELVQILNAHKEQIKEKEIKNQVNKKIKTIQVEENFKEGDI
ncbi:MULTISPECIES: hypothetical protein [Campylobacter]|uniref:hypothetical protein n=1 Tax=Campylobacter TaxID=194 RepID=UPI0008739CB3|nr:MULTISPECIES: hypothetical protein [Campylobacter]EAI7263290.1 hypothetical protein [Campylobacter lari]EJV5920782.1 plasmid mobilization relaxosome protein MobC [Campylobacter lari]MCV3531298.1 plasmid mobilization relaxosome protein MobC [Campylobacter sp. CNRCH_2007_0968H]MCW0224535.1 plasmid mobilization relaxosome protein MobC [Campylobacter lari]OEV68554.1 hypothetical protein AJY52_07590 [Campylobacter lari]